MNEENVIDLGKGALPSKYDIRDYWYKPVARGAFDWKTGFDIEKVLNKRLVTKDQNGSGSCGGQAWAYYGEVLEAIATSTYEPRSARWIYSHTRVAPAGSHGRDNCDFVKKKGWAREKDAPSYDNGKPPKESFMAQVPTLTTEGMEEAMVSRAMSYLRIVPTIELAAQAIEDNNGIVIMVNGQDNKTWRSAYPQPPKVTEWRHWLYAGKVKMRNGRKYIGVKNSWGDDVGERGWQWLGEEYFKTGNVPEAWTLAWDYEPAKTKIILKQMIELLKKLKILSDNLKY